MFMKKNLMFIAAGVIIALGACTGAKKAGEENASQFAGEQPAESGEYRAVSFQYVDSAMTRMPFDGRIIFALEPGNSGIYVYENGNRTHFTGRVVLKTEFVKTDSVYTATDTKDREVKVIVGAEIDTLVFPKGGKDVKVAFERKPVSAMPASDAWKRITDKL